VVYDTDDFKTKKIDLKNANYIGEAEFTLHSLVGNWEKSLDLELIDQKSKKKSGWIFINFEEMKSESNTSISF